MLTTGKAIELLIKSLPYPEQITNIETEKQNSIYFTWRRSKYKLDLTYCRVEMVNGRLLEGNDTSLLMSHLLKSQLSSVL